MSKSNQSPDCMVMGLSLATAPFLLGLLVVHAVAEELLQLGQNSEEIFRGDRLPILNFPETTDESNE
ncbi:hypothetical protein [Crocosphaera sp. XPORK-15E]|uniref:hypothetical protein n=1 Tax=Crocosphaera sp. XPORK-15E TaxID=3110247 RepID=UPI002B1ECCC0|nr:hypothetical protein [Crocosphaera sp. XPORK-15E]MEA5535987.1 hypothetical protein [Crocosphaera sp. XPORK-15E]